jgi:predicted GNAT family acetyltransferase
VNDAKRVIDNQGQSRFELTIGDEVAELTYRRRADRLVLIHTEVPQSLSGRGIGGLLVGAALERASRERLTIVPLCPYARQWLERNPDAAATVTVDWGPPPDD